MSYAEIQKVIPDVFDPAGGDVVQILGRNLGGTSDVRVGLLAATNVKEIASVPDFDGATDKLTSTLADTSFYTSTAAYSGWALVYINTIATNDTVNSYENDCIIATQSSAYWSLYLRSTGVVGVDHYQGTHVTVETQIQTQGWHLIQWKLDAGTLKIRVDGGTRATAAAAGWGSGGVFFLGSNYSGGHCFNGRIAEAALVNSTLSDANEDNVVAYVNSRYGFKFAGIAASAFDPATLSLTGWWRSGAYVSGTWTGTASAGASGGRNLTQATPADIPAVAETALVCTMPAGSAGTAVTAVPRFDGVNDKLSSSLNGDSFVSAAAGTIAIVYRNDIPKAPQVQPYNDSQLIGMNGQYGLLNVNSAGVRSALYNGATYDSDTFPVADQYGVHLAILKWDGTTSYLSVDGAPFRSLATTGPGLLGSGVLKLGANFNDSFMLGGALLDVMTINSTLSDARCLVDIAGYASTRYGLNMRGVAPSAFDPATLALTGWWRSGGYGTGTWTGTASAGSSGGRNLTEATNPPAVATPSVKKLHALTVKNATGRTTLSDAIQYANPATLNDCVWWLRPDDADVDVDGAIEVTTWRDKSGVGDTNRNVTPPTADNPAWNSADVDYGGKPTVGSFRRVGTFRLASGAWSESFPVYTLGVIGHALHGGSTYMTYESATQYNTVGSFSGTSTVYSLAAAFILNGTVSYSMEKPRTGALAIFNGTTASKFFAANEPAVTGNLGTGHILGGAAVNVGSYAGASETYGTEKIAEVYAYSRAISLREVRTLRRYRDSYYGAVV